MAWVHTSVWGRHNDALDTWSVGWCMLPSSKGLDQRHVGGHPITRGTLRGRRQLVRGTLQQLGEKGLRRWQLASAASDQVKQSTTIDLQLAEVLMAGASGWFTSRPPSGWWVVM